MNGKRTRTWLLFVGLLLLVWAAWAWYQEGARARRVRQLRQELLSEEGRRLSAEQKQEKVDELVQEYQGLSFKDRRQFASDSERLRAERERLRRFAEASAAARRAMLDEDIKRQQRLQEQLDKQLRRLQAAGARDAAAGAAGSKGRDKKAAQDRPRRAKATPEALDRMESYRKELLDMTTPQERAQRSLYLQSLNDRRKELGLKPLAAGRHF